jgi:hypothetical protein
MKQAHVPLKVNMASPKSILRKISLLEERKKKNKQGFKSLRTVLSVNAGHVRGGHSFH